jgi:hypothetical protein
MTFWEGFFIGIIVWLILRSILNGLISSLILEEVKKELEKTKEDSKEILLTLEKHQDILYCYRKDNNEFVGQGSNINEIIEIFRKKYPKNNGRILKEDGAELIEIRP